MNPDDTTGRPSVCDAEHVAAYTERAVADIRRRGLEPPQPYDPDLDPRRYPATLDDAQAEELRCIVAWGLYQRGLDDQAKEKAARELAHLRGVDPPKRPKPWPSPDGPWAEEGVPGEPW